MKLSRSEFDRLALEHVDMLFRLARRMTRDANRAEDLVQDTYLRAFAASDSFDLKAYGIRPWLVRILRNVHFSKSQRERKQPAAIDDEELQNNPDDDAPDRSTALTDSGSFDASGINFEAMDERLAAEVEKLPVDYQAVLLLWAVDELSYKEIADACDIPIGTVMSRLHRARAKLAKELSTYAENERIPKE
jgi:RNA polymerase sigma-70 factor (ECF subfamily)